MTPHICYECEVMPAPRCAICGVVNCPGCGGGMMGGQWCCLDHRCCVDSPDCDCAPWCVLCDNPVPHGHYCADTGALVYSAWPMEIAPSMPSSHTVVPEKHG